ncbi:hypothetical protein I7I53_08258 [Histoplasma capsulatum var. duboisii H88]|uniref:Uncharacterized protein n=1 Tax=Ajellomyces capsulatus (strain H88) TaxID=544711 RepID=A0A8A1LFC1_AJEC8|nr:hypothetical protein I7I53_08258 [Histoplasma capsulatum var. duboisii H88]
MDAPAANTIHSGSFVIRYKSCEILKWLGAKIHSKSCNGFVIISCQSGAVSPKKHPSDILTYSQDARKKKKKKREREGYQRPY